MKTDRKYNGPAIASLILFIIVYVFSLVLNVRNALHFGDMYANAVSLPSYSGQTVVFEYSEPLFSITSGIEMPEGEENALAWFEQCLPDTRAAYTAFFLTASFVYTALAFASLQYFLYKKNESSPGKHFRDALLGVLISWLVCAGTLFGILMAKGFRPALFPAARFLTVLSGFCVMVAAVALYAVLLRRIRFRIVAAIALVVLSVVFLIGGVISEGLLLEPKTEESFDYLFDVDERYGQEGYDDVIYYDDATDRVIIDGRSYEPEFLPNPNYVPGVRRAGLIIWEAVDPLANISRSYIESDPALLRPPLLYILKSAVLLLAAGWLTFREARLPLRPVRS